MKNNSGFKLVGVIVIIVITSIVSSIATGIIILNNSYNDNKNTININNDQELADFIEVYKTILSKYYDNNIDKKGMLNAAEEAMLKFLGDKYTTYLNDNEYQDMLSELSGEYNRIGLTIENNIVRKVASMSPAFNAGFMVDDIIVGVDGVNVEEQTGAEISKLIKNNNAKELDIQVLRNDEYVNLHIEKDIYSSVTFQKIKDTNIGYLYIKTFSQNLSSQVEAALADLENSGIESLIVDVRDNVGGYLSAAEETASLFLEKGKTIYSLEANNSKYTYADETVDKKEYPIAVIINSSSASASEILAAALKYSYNAPLVGNKSYGKGKVQQVVSLNSGDSVKYTSARWLTPIGICIDGVGLIPDYTVNYEDTDTYDTQLLKAIELLQ